MLRINGKWARALGAFGLAAAMAMVAGCGGGGGGGDSSTATTNSTSSTGSTGSTSSTSASTVVSTTPTTLANNQVAVVVSTGVTSSAKNIPMVSVTVCAPGTSTCQTIDNIQLDTGSIGLRLASDAVNSTLLAALPVETVSSQQVAECLSFADGNTWGSVRTADITIGQETASSIPVHIFGDLQQSAAGGTSNACASGTLNNTTAKLAAHGILGIGTAKYDCGSGSQGCTVSPNTTYFGCTTTAGTTSCGDLAVPVAQQVANPIQFFASDNNGVVLNMPAVTASGAISASGYLTFGIGTETNNVQPSGLQQLTLDHFGNAQSAALNGTSVTSAFFDTGSNGLFFTDSSISLCSGSTGFYCPAAAVSRQPSVTGYNSTTTSITVGVSNALTLFNSGNQAFNDLGGKFSSLSAAFDFGLPFFYGRTVYLGYDPVDATSFGSASAAYIAF